MYGHLLSCIESLRGYHLVRFSSLEEEIEERFIVQVRARKGSAWKLSTYADLENDEQCVKSEAIKGVRTTAILENLLFMVTIAVSGTSLLGYDGRNELLAVYIVKQIDRELYIVQDVESGKGRLPLTAPQRRVEASMI